MPQKQPKRGVEIAFEGRPTLALRGKAVLDTDTDGTEYVELRGDLVEEYGFRPSREFLAAAAAICTPDDALRFVARHGLLLEAAELEILDGGKGEWRKAGAALTLSEPLAAYFALAAKLREVRRLYDLSQRAWHGDRYSLASLPRALSEFLTTEDDDDKLVARRTAYIDALDPKELISYTSGRLAGTIDGALEAYDARFLIISLSPLAPGFALHPASATLAGHAWLQVAAEVLQRLELRECKDCGAFFAVTDPRQHYCSPRCAGRTRARRYRTAHSGK